MKKAHTEAGGTDGAKDILAPFLEKLDLRVYLSSNCPSCGVEMTEAVEQMLFLDGVVIYTGFCMTCNDRANTGDGKPREQALTRLWPFLDSLERADTRGGVL
jgi:hypothetical protein